MSEQKGEGGDIYLLVRNIFPLFANKKRGWLVSPRETRICTKRGKQNIKGRREGRETEERKRERKKRFEKKKMVEREE